MSQLLEEVTTAEKIQKSWNLHTIVFKSSAIMLITIVWISALLFGLYILAFYAAALYKGTVEQWNDILPGLYEQDGSTANASIGVHFAAGGIILVLGCIQLIGSVRRKYPALHRWIGRVYVLSCLLAAVGGLTFIAVRGTIGGTVMNIGFSLYGILMLVAGVQTYRHAIARDFEKHRAWGLRLFALAIGSWLYRMDYGFWLMLGGPGHADYFSGPFDKVMAFFFYLPNLLVVEIFLRARTYHAPPVLKWIASVILLFATGFLSLGTYYFTKFYWGPAIVGWWLQTTG